MKKIGTTQELENNIKSMIENPLFLSDSENTAKFYDIINNYTENDFLKVINRIQNGYNIYIIYNFISNLKLDIALHNSAFVNKINNFFKLPFIFYHTKYEITSNKNGFNDIVEFILDNKSKFKYLYPSFQNSFNSSLYDYAEFAPILLSFNKKNLITILEDKSINITKLLQNYFNILIEIFNKTEFLKFFGNLHKVFSIDYSENQTRSLLSSLNIEKVKDFFQDTSDFLSFFNNVLGENEKITLFTGLIEEAIKNKDLEYIKKLFNVLKFSIDYSGVNYYSDYILQIVITNANNHALLPDLIPIIMDNSGPKDYVKLSEIIQNSIIKNDSIDKEIKKQVEKVFEKKFNMEKYIFEYNSNNLKKYQNIDLSKTLTNFDKFIDFYIKSRAQPYNSYVDKLMPTIDSGFEEIALWLMKKIYSQVKENAIMYNEQKTFNSTDEFYLKILNSPEISKEQIDNEILLKSLKASLLWESALKVRLVGNTYYDSMRYFSNEDVADSVVNQLETQNTLNLKMEFKKFIQFLIEKKDLYFLQNINIFTDFPAAKIISSYLSVKNKDFTEIYKYVKSNVDSLNKLKSDLYPEMVIVLNLNQADTSSTENGDFLSMEYLAKNSQSFEQYIKKIDRAAKISQLSHNGTNNSLLKFAFENEKFSLNMPSNLEILDIIDNYLKFLNIKSFPTDNVQSILNQLSNLDELLNKATIINQEVKEINPDKEFINLEQFKNNSTLLKNIISNFFNKKNINYKGDEKTIFKTLHSTFSLIKQYETVKQYYKVAKPKDEKILQFSLDLSPDLKFEALPFLDPEHFTIGAATDCCQRIGGLGENAAIDSFINPLASSIKLTYKNDIIAQSYFHYVPEDNGLILDNVEFNEQNCNKYFISNAILANIYADYAKKIKEKLNLNYVLCGKAYNKFDSSLFESTKLKKDPRYFEITNLNKSIYSDFDHRNAIDLLNPTKDINQYNYQNIKQASNQLTKLAINNIKLKKHSQLSIQLVRMMYINYLHNNT